MVVLYRAIIILAYIGVKSWVSYKKHEVPTTFEDLVIGRVSVAHRINFCVVVLLLLFFFFGGGGGYLRFVTCAQYCLFL